MDEEKIDETEQAPDPEAAPEGGDAPEEQADGAQQKEIWREGLVQEALANRPELRRLAAEKDFAASRKVGCDLGFEDAARKLTLDQLQEFQALIDRRITSYARHEMPGELRGYLDERSVGLDPAGFLAGYVDGVGAFLEAYKEQLARKDS